MDHEVLREEQGQDLQTLALGFLSWPSPSQAPEASEDFQDTV